MTFIRDNDTGAIINTDDDYYKMILSRREQKKKSSALEQEIDCLKCEITEIKNLLKKILNGKNYG